MATAKKKTPSFEDGLERLETLAAQMEQSELPLDQLLALYEEGMSLSAELTKKLQTAQGRMLEIKQGKDGKPATVPSDVVEQPTLFDERYQEGERA